MGMQSMLGAPRHADRGGRRRVLSDTQSMIDRRPVPIMPRGLDEDPAQVGITGFRASAALLRGAAGIFRGTRPVKPITWRAAGNRLHRHVIASGSPQATQIVTPKQLLEGVQRRSPCSHAHLDVDGGKRRRSGGRRRAVNRA